MTSQLIFWPVLTQIVLTLFVFILLGKRKAHAMKTGQVDRQKTALDNQAWPDDVIQVSNNIQNQFQTPVLFYALCLSFFCLDAVSTTVLVLAWFYVVTRLIHAFVHVGSNYIPVRFRVFILGCVSLIVLSVLLGLALSQ